MPIVDAECEARAILERAGFSLYDVPGALRLVHELMGRGVVRKVAPRVLFGAEAEICVLNGQPRIYVSNRLTPIKVAFAVLHEVAHWHLGIMAHGAAEIELACDQIAAALICPRGAFREAVAEHGDKWEQLALDFGTDASCAALRYGEVMDCALALVTPAIVRVRGPEDFVWPEERQLRRLAKTALPGMRRDQLPDDRRRFVLLVGS